MQFTIAKTREELQAALAELWREHGSIALVPTMGALHDGHMALVEHAKQFGGVVLYIFVNPLQFDDEKDFNAYPRDLEADAEKCRAAGVEVVYAPEVEDVYPPGFGTLVTMGGPAEILEGAYRPGHFNGVCTVLAKMFIRILPNVVVFGEKDYQQLIVVRKLVRDLDLPIEVIGLPTIREASGLAMSSRNARLKPDEKASAATQLYTVLTETARAMAEKGGDTQPYLKLAFEKLQKAGFTKVDYVAVCNAETLEPLGTFAEPARLLAAAWLGNTRLIDNIPVP